MGFWYAAIFNPVTPPVPTPTPTPPPTPTPTPPTPTPTPTPPSPTPDTPAPGPVPAPTSDSVIPEEKNTIYRYPNIEMGIEKQADGTSIDDI